jgi:HlyD family secretion protein
MLPKRLRWVMGLSAALMLTLVVAGTVWYVHDHPSWWFWVKDQTGAVQVWLGLRSDQQGPGQVASGFIEAKQVSLAAELGGRIVDLAVDEGDEVSAGQILVRLDDRLLRAQQLQAQAAVALAQASLAQAEAGSRPTALAKAAAEVRQAEAVREAAEIAWEDAVALAEHPQQLEAAVVTARMEAEIAQYQRARAAAMANAAQLGRNLADDVLQYLLNFGEHTEFVMIAAYDLTRLPDWLQLPPDWGEGEYQFGEYTIIIHDGIVEVWTWITVTIPPAAIDSAEQEQAQATYDSWRAWLALDASEASQEGAQRILDQLIQQRNSPLSLQAQATAAEVQLRLAEAAVGLAEAQLEGLKIGATPGQIAVAQARLAQATAALQSVSVQRAKQILRAPIAGLVGERLAQEGEVAIPGAPLLALADLDQVNLTLYVPQADLGGVSVGAPVSVTVDAYPERTFAGIVSFISSDAEYTPRNVQTREERVSLVFAVRVRVPNPDHALKPGMPADATFGTVSGTPGQTP